jgi:threonine/homoserine/homoserine lactone efflux protein
MSLHTWLFFSGTEALLCLSPGPAVLFVLSYGLRRGGRASLWANAGILTGNAFYFVLSAFGLGAVLLASYGAFTVIKYAGAAYLIYLGAQTIRGAGLAWHSTGVATTATEGCPPSPAARASARHLAVARMVTNARGDGWRTLKRGFALQAANPKALVFFAALLPQFIDASRPIAAQVLILGITSVVIEFLVLGAYGYLASRAATVARKPEFVTITNRVSGGMLIVAGAGIAVSGD